MKKRVLTIDLRWIDSSGIGTYIQGILPGIIEALDDVEVVGIGDRRRLEQFAWSAAQNVRLISCHADRYSLAEQWQVLTAIPKNTDLFFAPHYPTPLLYRGPLAVTVHDMSHLIVPEIAGNWKKRAYAEIMFRTIRKRAAVVFTVSEFSRRELLRLTQGKAEQKIVPTPLGITQDWYEAKQESREHPGPYLVYVGNIKPYKNVGRLVEAFLSIRDRVPHDLLLVGQSEGLITGESQQFFERVRSAGNRIQMTGFVSRSQLLSLVGHADALVLPSLYEGFGLPPLEAMAAGTPVVVSRVASLPEVCGEAALYFDPLDVSDMANTLARLLLDADLALSMSKLGRERSERFRWETCAEKTAAELRKCLAR